MFKGCKKFNQPLKNWNVSNVTQMSSMFMDCEEFDQELNTWKDIDGIKKWDVSNVTNMKSMFNGCKKFNQPLDKWNVSKVTSMQAMFKGSEEFNQDLNTWIWVDNTPITTRMFEGSKIEDKNKPDYCKDPVHANINIEDQNQLLFATHCSDEKKCDITADEIKLYNDVPVEEEQSLYEGMIERARQRESGVQGTLIPKRIGGKTRRKRKTKKHTVTKKRYGKLTKSKIKKA